MEGKTRDLDSRLITHTEAHLEKITECVALLSRLLEEHSGDDHRETADEIRALESECDASNRRISALISNTAIQDLGLRNARIHLNSPQLLDLYRRLDGIPNTAERIAEVLVTIDPPNFEAFRPQFREMVECATTAMTALDGAVITFIRLLCSPKQSGSVADEIRTVREAESSCDRLRNELVSGAFSDGSVARPMIYREFALLFDRLVDAMEDVTDQIVLVSSSEPWITTEPASER